MSNRKVSDADKRRRAEQAKADRARKDRMRLLYTRAEVAEMLGVSVATVIRLEADGRLPALKLGTEANCRALYRAVDVHKLAGIELEVA